MINILKLKAFQDILASGVNINYSDLGNNELLENKIKKGFSHSFFDLVGKKLKIGNKPFNIHSTSITTTGRIGKSHSEADTNQALRIERFYDLKDKIFNKESFLFYIHGKQYKKILVDEFQAKFIEAIQYCPYCGIEQLKKGNKELDHFFPRTLFPEFSYSLFNIIPVCHICNSNSYKGGKYFNKNGLYFHPYFGYLDYNNGFIKLFASSKDLDDGIFFNQNQITKYDNKMLLWDILHGGIESHLDFFSFEEKYRDSDSTSEELSDFNNKRNSILDRINVYKTEQDKIYFIKDLFSNNGAKNWPFEKESILISKNGKMRKDLFFGLLDDFRKNNKF